MNTQTSKTPYSKICFYLVTFLAIGILIMTLFPHYARQVGLALTFISTNYLKTVIPQKTYSKRQNFCFFLGFFVTALASYFAIENFESYFGTRQVSNFGEVIILFVVLCSWVSAVFSFGYGVGYLITKPWLNRYQK